MMLYIRMIATPLIWIRLETKSGSDLETKSGSESGLNCPISERNSFTRRRMCLVYKIQMINSEAPEP
jgi:hypothetical protein